jgi:hypothetical protein
LASADGEPSPDVLLNVDDETHRARIAGSRSCRLQVFESCFEPSLQEANRASYCVCIRRRHRAPFTSASSPGAAGDCRSRLQGHRAPQQNRRQRR